MGKPIHLLFIALLVVLLISACSSATDTQLLGRGLPGEVSDPSEYSRILQEAGDVPALAHFPTSIPENAELVRFHFHPAAFQGGSALQLRLRLPAPDVKEVRSKYIYTENMDLDGTTEDEEARITGFYTSGDSSNVFPDQYEILVLDIEHIGSDKAPWNHGVSYGLAVSLPDSEIVYWYEDW